MRKALSYPCPFCPTVSEKRKTAQLHAEKHVPLLNRRIAKRKAKKQRAAKTLVAGVGRLAKARILKSK